MKLIMSLCTALLLFGCARKNAESPSTETAERQETAPVTFKAGRGLALSKETQSLIGLRTAEVAESTISMTRRLVVQVFTASPTPRGSVTVPLEEAKAISGHKNTGPKLIGVDAAASASAGYADLIFEVPAEQAVRIGDFVNLSLTTSSDASVATVPRSAVLDTQSGSIVYVVNGDHYLRTVIKTGLRNENACEVLDGLYAGDVVVTNPVQTLWLTELRLINGGGTD